MHRRPVVASLSIAAVLLVGGCTSDVDGSAPDSGGTADDADDGTAGEPTSDGENDDGPSEQRYPDVIDAELEPSGDAWRLSATIFSPYDTPERYADAFRAVTPGGEVLGVRDLVHDHADEQPFTRALGGLVIPDDVDEIIIEGRDQRYGWGGETVTLRVPDR